MVLVISIGPAVHSIVTRHSLESAVFVVKRGKFKPAKYGGRVTTPAIWWLDGFIGEKAERFYLTGVAFYPSSERELNEEFPAHTKLQVLVNQEIDPDDVLWKSQRIISDEPYHYWDQCYELIHGVVLVVMPWVLFGLLGWLWGREQLRRAEKKLSTKS